MVVAAKHSKDINSKKRILVIEDNYFNLKLFRDVLNLNGYEVIEHCKAEGAIDLIDESKPDLVLLDIGLPDMSGRDLVKDIKGNTDIAYIPVIAVTAFALKDEQDGYLAEGFDAFLTKPVSLKGFLEKVKEFVSS